MQRQKVGNDVKARLISVALKEQLSARVLAERFDINPVTVYSIMKKAGVRNISKHPSVPLWVRSRSLDRC